MKFTSETRDEIYHPFDYGDYTYASDGSILVRVPKCAHEKSIGNPPKRETVWAMFQFDPQSVDWIPVPEIPPVKESETNTCECCGRPELVDDPKYLMIGKSAIDKKYLRLIKELPNVMIENSAKELDPVKFKFDGGFGLVMPLRLYQ